VALGFRDQSAEVIRKARRRQGDATITEASSKQPPASAAVGDAQAGPLMLSSISVPVNDQATGFIFSHYVWSGSNRTPGYLSYLHPLLASDAGPAVTASINAVGLAALSNIHISPNLMLAARQEYTAALAATNAALQDRACSKLDSTLAAVVLLGMYEVVFFPPPIDELIVSVQSD
jgi:hypothetical protein